MSCKIGTHIFIDGVCPHCGDTMQDYIDALETKIGTYEDKEIVE